MSLLSPLLGLFKKTNVDFLLSAAVCSAQGLVRRDNQDAVLSIPALGLFCVADGMGGASGGALASAWTCDALAAIAPQLAAATLTGPQRLSRMDAALQAVNTRIRAYAREQGYKMMGTTVALILFNPLNRQRAIIVYAGDSRVYRWRKGALQQLTRDHTMSHARDNPLAHVLTRAIGPEYRVRAAWKMIDVKAGDRYLLCSDGVHDMLSNAAIAHIFKRGGTPEHVRAHLEQAVCAAGAGDNYSILICDVTRR